MKERRKFPRYVVEEETALFTEPKIVLSDSLVDVSQGGLAFNYEDKKPFNIGVLVRMDIIRDDVTILNIPVKIISDIEIQNPAELSRRCGVEFGQLSREQQEKIAFLLKKFASKNR